MFEKNFYTLRGIADELNISESTIRFWQDQYGSLIPYTGSDTEKWYPKEAIEVLRYIKKKANSGMNENEIEIQLKREYQMIAEKRGEAEVSVATGPQVSLTDTAQLLIKEMLENISDQQMRIADAQERRAAAEEKKAVALEKRAAAQLLMVESINNITLALNKIGSGQILQQAVDEELSMNRDEHDSLNNSTETIAPKPTELDDLLKASVETIASESDELSETLDEPDLSTPKELIDVQQETGNEGPDDLNDLLIDSPERSSNELDDLSALVDIDEVSAETELDDLSALLDQPSETASPELDDLSALVGIDEVSAETELDDLSELLDQPSETASPELDDLSALVDIDEVSAETELDNLSELLDESSETEPPELDDLSALVDIDEVSAETKLDNLSELLDQPSETASPELDDLSALVDEKEEIAEPELDDLSELIDNKAKSAPSGGAGQKEKIDVSEKAGKVKEKLKKIPDDYKSKIIALIIQMKEKKGLSIEESTSYLNQKGYKTISGGNQWDHGMIQEIYNHINHVRTGKKATG